MPFLKKPVAFDSINFLPGFPSLSAFSCNPWDTGHVAGACASTPVQIARQPSTMPASTFMARAMLEAGVGAPKFDRMMRRGVVPAGMAGIVQQLRGIGGGGYAGDGGSIGDGYRITRLGGGGRGAGGCGCGGKCGGCSTDHSHGLGFALSDITADPMAWLSSNAIPLAIGAAAAYFIFKRR